MIRNTRIEPTETQEVAPGVFRVPLKTATLPPATRTNAFVIKTPAGVLIVDPGSSGRREIERLMTVVSRTGRLQGYIITHHHGDHWAGLKRLLDGYPLPVVAHTPTKLALGGSLLRSPEWFAERNDHIVLIHTPGHASDHLAIVLQNGDIIAGDLVAGTGTVVIDPPDGSMVDYLQTLERLIERGVGKLFPAHGGTINNGTGLLVEYRDHRIMREKQVVAALSERPGSRPLKLVPPIYSGEVPLLLFPIAARSVLAHLIKLECEGRARREGMRWWMVD